MAANKVPATRWVPLALTLAASGCFDPDGGDPARASREQIDQLVRSCSLQYRDRIDAEGVGIYENEPGREAKWRCLQDGQERLHVRFPIYLHRVPAQNGA